MTRCWKDPDVFTVQKTDRSPVPVPFVELVRQLADGCTAIVLEHLRDEAFEVEAFGHFLNDQRLCNLAYSLLDPATGAACLPQTFLRFLQRHYERQQLRQVQQQELLERIDSCFTEAGIDYLVLKGFATSSRYYPATLQRYQNDIDLLVPPAQVNRSLKALARVGLELPVPHYRISRRRRAVDYEVTLRQKPVGVDLHWKIRCLPGLQIREDLAWEQSEIFLLGDRVYRTAGDEYALTALLVCIALDLGRGSWRLKHFVDLYRQLSLWPDTYDWPEFLGRKSGEGVEPLCRHVLGILGHLFPAQQPDAGSDRPNALTALHRTLARLPAGSIPDRELTRRLLENPRPDLENKLWLWRLLPFAPAATLGFYCRRCLLEPEKIPGALGRGWNLAKGGMQRLARVVSR